MSGATASAPGEERLAALVDAFARAYGMVVEESASREAADLMLQTLVVALGGDYGFLGFRRLDDRRAPYLHTMAMSDIAWNEATAAAYATHLSEGMKFRNLDTLFGHVLVHEEVLIARDARRHPSAHGVPEGHPRLDRFLGIPVRQRGRMEGLIGIANFDDGLWDDTLLAFADRTSAVMYPLFEAMEHDRVAQSRRDSRARARFDLLERVVGGFAHHLNNELVVISEVREALATSPEHLDRELAADVHGSVTAITDLLSDLKTFARVADTDDLLGTLRSAARIAGLIALTDCELVLARLPTGAEIAIPPRFLLSWLVEAALLLTQALSAVHPLRLDCRACDRSDDRGPCLELTMGPMADLELAPVPLDALADEGAAWGVEIHWRDKGRLRLRIPLRPRTTPPH